MIVLSNSIAQTLAPGQSATFNLIILHTGCGECHRPNSGSVGLMAKTGIYDISFTGNIGATAPGVAELSINYDGSALPETTMLHTTTTAGDLDNVSCHTAVKTCCCDGGAVTVTNTGTTTITLGDNPCLYVKRVA